MKKRIRIDKSKLAIGIPLRIVDKPYRQSYRNATCEASYDGTELCGMPAIGAHCRTGNEAGFAQKPSDDLTFPLCDEHHMEQEKYIGADWWLDSVLKPQMRRRYRRWKM